MRKRVISGFILSLLILGVCGCEKKNSQAISIKDDNTKQTTEIVYLQNDSELRYRENYRDAETERLIVEFYNPTFLDTDIDSENGYLYYKLPMGEMYGDLYRVEISSMKKDQENRGELISENVVRDALQFAKGGVLFQKYENEVWTLYFSRPNEELKLILDGDVVKYFVKEDNIYICEKVDADEHATNRLCIWKYNLDTNELVELEQGIQNTLPASNEDEILRFFKYEEESGRALYAVKANGEITKCLDNIEGYYNESNPGEKNLIFYRSKNDNYELLLFDGDKETLLEDNVEPIYVIRNVACYKKNNQIYIRMNNNDFKLSEDIDLENRLNIRIEELLDNGDILVEIEDKRTEMNDQFNYSYAIWKVQNNEIIDEKILVYKCDKDSQVIKNSIPGGERVYLYTNTAEESNTHQLSLIEPDGSLRCIDSDFSQGYIDGADVFSLKGEEFGSESEITYQTLHSRGRVVKFNNSCTFSVLHIDEDFIDEEVLGKNVTQVVFDKNGGLFCISEGDLLRIDNNQNIRLLPHISYVWTPERKVKIIGGKVIDRRSYSNRF